MPCRGQVKEYMERKNKRERKEDRQTDMDDQVTRKVTWGKRRKHNQPLWVVLVVSVAELLGWESSSPLTKEGEKLQLIGTRRQILAAAGPGSRFLGSQTRFGVGQVCPLLVSTPGWGFQRLIKHKVTSRTLGPKPTHVLLAMQIITGIISPVPVWQWEMLVPTGL